MGGKLHTGVIGAATFSTANGLTLPTTYTFSTLQTKRSDYRISYPFKSGYIYRIEVTASGYASNSTAYPSLGAALFTAAGLTYTSTSCTAGYISGLPQFGSVINTQVNGTSTVYSPTSANFTSPNDFDYLVLEATCQAAQDLSDLLYIQKIEIIETAPISFTLPATTTFGCGTTTPQTFTVTNVYGTTGISNYTWNLGSASNNWLYNGSPATQTISTGIIGSISLTPVCGKAQSNVYATVTANGNTYNTNTSSVSYTPLTATITGNSAICTETSSYQINGLPCNSTVVWSATPSAGVVSFNPNTYPVILTKTGNGVINLTATITTQCTSTPVTISKNNILVGLPSFNGAPDYYTDYGGPYPLLLTLPFGNHPIPNEICENHGGITDINIVGATSILWNKTDQSPGASVTWYPDSYNNLKFWIHNSGDWAAFKITYGNECGSSDVTYKFKAITCDPYPPHSDIVTGGQFMISPNPASGTVTISPNSKSKISKTTIGKVGIIQVSIIDVNGILKKQQQFSANTANMQLDVSGLMPGIYFVQIINGDIYDTEKLIISR